MNRIEPRSTHSDALARLEARVRWLGALTTFLSLGFVGLLVWEFFPRTPVLEGRRFVLRDDEWRRRAELGFRDDGSPALRLLGPDGRTRASFNLSSDGGGALRLDDTQGTDRVRLSLRADGSPALMLMDEKGRPVVTASAGEGEAPVLRLESEGRVVWQGSK